VETSGHLLNLHTTSLTLISEIKQKAPHTTQLSPNLQTCSSWLSFGLNKKDHVQYDWFFSLTNFFPLRFFSNNYWFWNATLPVSLFFKATWTSVYQKHVLKLFHSSSSDQLHQQRYLKALIVVIRGNSRTFTPFQISIQLWDFHFQLSVGNSGNTRPSFSTYTCLTLISERKQKAPPHNPTFNQNW